MQVARKSDQAADRAADVETFYVIMDTAAKVFLQADEVSFGAYQGAAQFPTSESARFELAGDYTDDCRVVGLCMEGEEP